MTDNRPQGPFVPTPSGSAPYGVDGPAPGPPQYGSQPYPGPPQPPGQYPQAGQWNLQWPAPYGVGQAQPMRRTGMLVIGIILTVFGGLALLGQLTPVATSTATESSGSTGPVYTIAYLASFLVFAVVPLVAGIIMIVRSKRR